MDWETQKTALRAVSELDWGIPEKEEAVLYQIIKKSNPDLIMEWIEDEWEIWINKYPTALSAALYVGLENKAPDDKRITTLLTQIIKYILQMPEERGYRTLISDIVKFLSKGDLQSLIALLAVEDIKNSKAFENLYEEIFYTIMRHIYKNDILQSEQVKLIPSKVVMEGLTPEAYLNTLFQESHLYIALQNIQLSDEILERFKAYYISYIMPACSINNVSSKQIEYIGKWYIDRGNTSLSLKVGLNFLRIIYDELEDQIVNTNFWKKLAAKAAKVGLPFKEINIFPADLAVLGLPAYFEILKKDVTSKTLAFDFIGYVFYYGNYWEKKLFDTDYYAPTSAAYRKVLYQLKELQSQPTHIQIAAAEAVVVNHVRTMHEDGSSVGWAYLRSILSSVKKFESIKPFLITLTATHAGRKLFLEVSEEFLSDNILSLDKWLELINIVA